MRYLRAIWPLMLTVVIVYVLNKPIGSTPAIGKILDPIGGFWVSAEPVSTNAHVEIPSTQIGSNVNVWFDERMVPHINAGNDYDLYFAQGYIHAYFRLWQMDLQTRAAAGRISELLGKKALNYDRGQRRKGMVYGAENSLRAMERDPRTKTSLDGYRDGINAYMNSLKEREIPLEYKLMNFVPEPWDNIKTALLLMYMSDDLSGDVHDIGLTYYLENVLSKEELDFYFPEKVPGSTPVIPEGTKYNQPSLAEPPVPQGEIWGDITFKQKPKDKSETGKGSNNWVVSGSRTQKGTPILCNDPHLSLNLPSLWFEVQLTAPGINVYGVSLPGAPGVIIGFNDSISWGFTNNYRDVKDYYTIDVIDGDNYRFNGQQTRFEKRVEVVKIKDSADYVDTVNYTVHGPLQFDSHFREPNGIEQPLALQWMALEESNELLSVYLLNRSKNYNDYTNAIGYFLCPAQNFIYADAKGNIALWGQGQYINKWKGQGKYIMNGADSSTLWGDYIPVAENPHALNPEQGYLASANQNVADSSYPYWFNGRFNELRAWRINEMLDTISNVTVEDMFRMQNDEHSLLARKLTPYLLNILSRNNIADDKYNNVLKTWDYIYSAESIAPTVFQEWWSVMYPAIWADVLKVAPDGLLPLPERTMQILLNNPDRLPHAEQVIVKAYQRAVDSLNKLNDEELQWYKMKNTGINHLAKLKPFSFSGIKNGGWGNTINAMKGNHGPSWRMVVQMNNVPEAYGVYPGGQSGNPGSKYYGNFIDKWIDGKYNKLTFVSQGAKPEESIVRYNWEIKAEKK